MGYFWLCQHLYIRVYASSYILQGTCGLILWSARFPCLPEQYIRKYLIILITYRYNGVRTTLGVLLWIIPYVSTGYPHNMQILPVDFSCWLFTLWVVISNRREISYSSITITYTILYRFLFTFYLPVIAYVKYITVPSLVIHITFLLKR